MTPRSSDSEGPRRPRILWVGISSAVVEQCIRGTDSGSTRTSNCSIYLQFSGFFYLSFSPALLDFEEHVRPWAARIERGDFELVNTFSPMASWCRLRHASWSRSSPLRSRSMPFGLLRISTERGRQVQRDNAAFEVCVIFAELASRVTPIPTSYVLVFPDDLYGHMITGPASPCLCLEIKQLASSLARRGVQLRLVELSADSRLRS